MKFQDITMLPNLYAWYAKFEQPALSMAKVRSITEDLLAPCEELYLDDKFIEQPNPRLLYHFLAWRSPDRYLVWEFFTSVDGKTLMDFNVRITRSIRSS